MICQSCDCLVIVAVREVPLSRQNVAASTQKCSARREIQDAMVSRADVGLIDGILGWLTNFASRYARCSDMQGSFIPSVGFLPRFGRRVTIMRVALPACPLPLIPSTAHVQSQPFMDIRAKRSEGTACVRVRLPESRPKSLLSDQVMPRLAKGQRSTESALYKVGAIGHGLWPERTSAELDVID